jgi:hypothetical protein
MNVTELTKKLIKYKPIVKILASSKNNKINKSIIKNMDKDLLHTISNLISNILSGQIKLSKSDYSNLTKYKFLLRKIVKNSKLKSKRALMSQQGGFLPTLIPAEIKSIDFYLNQNGKGNIHPSQQKHLENEATPEDYYGIPYAEPLEKTEQKVPKFNKTDQTVPTYKDTNNVKKTEQNNVIKFRNLSKHEQYRQFLKERMGATNLSANYPNYNQFKNLQTNRRKKNLQIQNTTGNYPHNLDFYSYISEKEQRK